MFRRLFWLALGLGMGLGLSFWIARLARQTVARYSPERLGNDLAEALRGLSNDVQAAVSEGLVAMREREAELRARTVPAL